MKFFLIAISVVFLLFPASSVAQGYFTVGLIPDTQNYRGIGSTADGVNSIKEQMKYLVRNRDRLHLAGVFGLGDIVSSDCTGNVECAYVTTEADCNAIPTGGDPDFGGCLWNSGNSTCGPLVCESTVDNRWENASRAWALLGEVDSYNNAEGAGIPHSVPPGNHDCDEPHKYRCSGTKFCPAGPGTAGNEECEAAGTTACSDVDGSNPPAKNTCWVAGDASNLNGNPTTSSSNWTQAMKYFNGYDYPVSASYRPANRWGNYTWYGEQFDPARPSSYRFFTADGIRMINISLEFRYSSNYPASYPTNPNNGETLLEWVTDIFEDNPGLPVVFSTHHQLETTRSGLCADVDGSGDRHGTDSASGLTNYDVYTTNHVSGTYGVALRSGVFRTADCQFYEEDHAAVYPDGTTFYTDGTARRDAWIWTNFVDVTTAGIAGRVWGIFNGHYTYGNAQASVVTTMSGPKGGQKVFESFQNFQEYFNASPPGWFTLITVDRAKSELRKTTISPHRGDLMWSPLSDTEKTPVNSADAIGGGASPGSANPIDPFTHTISGFTLSNLTECNDGLDNNGNGRVDFRGESADPDTLCCTGYDDPTEC